MMKIDDCILEAEYVASRSPTRHTPEQEWVDANKKSTVPEFVYRFYCLADYFSFDKAPRFLNDPRRILFSFLAALIRGTLESFDEAHSLVETIQNDQGKGYSPLKKLRGEKWDPEADTRQRRSFRYLIVSLASILDQFAEVVSIFFHGDVKGLTVGRASFMELRKFARDPFVLTGTIVTPKQACFQEIHTILVDELETTGDDQHWIELFYLYRNKLAHLGSPMFPIISFCDSEGTYYAFSPNRWPLFHQSEIKQVEMASDKSNPKTIEFYAKSNYVHQDIVSYSIGLLARVDSLINRSFEVLCATYNDFKEFQFNESAFCSLKDKEQQYLFKFFS